MASPRCLGSPKMRVPCSEACRVVLPFWAPGRSLAGSTRQGVACFRGARGGLSGTEGLWPFLLSSLLLQVSLELGPPCSPMLREPLGQPSAGVREGGRSRVGFWPGQSALVGVLAASLWSRPLAGWGRLPPAPLLCWGPGPTGGGLRLTFLCCAGIWGALLVVVPPSLSLDKARQPPGLMSGPSEAATGAGWRLGSGFWDLEGASWQGLGALGGLHVPGRASVPLFSSIPWPLGAGRSGTACWAGGRGPLEGISPRELWGDPAGLQLPLLGAADSGGTRGPLGGTLLGSPGSSVGLVAMARQDGAGSGHASPIAMRLLAPRDRGWGRLGTGGLPGIATLHRLLGKAPSRPGMFCRGGPGLRPRRSGAGGLALLRCLSRCRRSWSFLANVKLQALQTKARLLAQATSAQSSQLNSAVGGTSRSAPAPCSAPR